MSYHEGAEVQGAASYLLWLGEGAPAKCFTSLLRACKLGSSSSLRKLLRLHKNSINLPAHLLIQRENFLGGKKLAVLNVVTLSDLPFSARTAFTY